MLQVFTKKNIVTHNKNFMLLLLGKTVSDIGNWIYYIGIIYCIADMTKSATSTGFVLFCNILPSIVFGVVAGSMCDKLPKKNILIISDFISGFLSLYLGIRIVLGGATVTEVYIVTFSLGISKTFFSPALKSSIPSIVNVDELNRANSLMQATSSLTNILGPICGGTLIAFIGLPIAFIINGISFILSAISEIFIKIPYTKRNKPSNKKYYKQLINDTSIAFKFIRSNKTISSILIIFSFMTFFVAPIVLFLHELVGNYYHRGPMALSIIMIADAAGVLVAGLYLIAKPIVKNQKFFLTTFPIFCGISLIIIGNIKNFYLAVIIMFLQGFISGFGEISMMTIFQKETPDDKRGMIFSLFSIIMNILTPLSLLMSGFVLSNLSIATILSICGLILIIGSGLLVKNLLLKQNVKLLDDYDPSC